MNQRTDARHQTVFHQPNKGVTLEFVEQNKIKFTLAAGSRWRFPYHRHELHNGCRRISCLHGRMLVTTETPYGGSGSSTGGPGTYDVIRPGDLHIWSSQGPDQELVVLLETEDDILNRNTSSAILDAIRFPFLSSTPFGYNCCTPCLTFRLPPSA
jgi:hypothetical protein